ncbi:hypothetical protein OIO90_003987 [Microbotryomycetes sp. JL221]|nr:hypothetical protein OIO90_003987 [Microbotryomycetes sp. JL221]
MSDATGVTATKSPAKHKLSRRPSLPTTVLPRLPRDMSTMVDSHQLLRVVNHLTSLYSTTSTVTTPNGGNNNSSTTTTDYTTLSEDESNDFDALGPSSQFERGYTKSWLVSLLRKSEQWIEQCPEDDDEELNLRTKVVELAGQLVATLTETSVSGSILRPLLFPTCEPDAQHQTEPLLVTLNDALPSSLDPTSVGLQSWGASIILSRLMCLKPQDFGIGYNGSRCLELGAGTGLLSLVWKGMNERLGADSDVVATDFHDEVLSNLKHNVKSNTPTLTPNGSRPPSQPGSPSFFPVDAPQRALQERRSATSSSRNSLRPSPSNSMPGTPVNLSPQEQPIVAAHKLDWSAVHTSRKFATSTSRGRLNMPEPFDKPFNTILGADVVYGPEHAQWLKSCVEQFLIRPDGTGSRPTSPVLGSQQRLNGQTIPTSLPPLEELDLDGEFVPPKRRPSPPPLDTPPSVNTFGPEPMFYLIVPVRPTHLEAIKTIPKVFPLVNELSKTTGQEWQIATKNVTELERTKGVGRSDETKYILYEIGWV